MKTDSIIIAGMVGVALYLLSKKGGWKMPEFVRQIDVGNLRANDPGYGWQYYSNGTSIDPYGNYYFNGKLVWLNPQGGVMM